ncbi:hypothetical protein [Actinomadura decatromicini]|uniref:Uncharacterized protein n=1 Tax=Actinomadura decatromicini TaxID=2604572 RepID=A0A5D3FAS1_9ACTN|nr:hypothetical protein [Actinomadura decatromicini]TYK45411.1 hypothetical protein FXF68_32700 [Actinomadura decatromicini]
MKGLVITFRPGPDRDKPDKEGASEERAAGERPEELLQHACTLVRLCGRDSAVAAVFLALVLAGTASRLAAGSPGPAALALLPVLAASFAVSAGYAVRSRRTLLTVLAGVRGRTGAPLDPSAPWTPFGSATALDARVRDAELRRLLSAAHRCGELSWQAVAWSVATSVLFLFWTLAASMT